MLVQQESLQSYFHNHLHNSLRKHKVKTTDFTVIYLSNLLTKFSKSENFIDDHEGRSPYKPLALHYSDALHSDSEQQRDAALRRIGDIALFVCGLFSDSLAKKAVDIDYYMAMGGSAYSYLSESKTSALNKSYLYAVFHELSNKFIDFADVLSELRDGQVNKNILRTYEIWLRTGSKKAQKLLNESGIQPLVNSASLLKQ